MICIAECFPNGTITAWALKLKSVPSLDPSKLILNDPTCRPSFSDDRSAYFVFAANTCGTTRKVPKWKVLQLARKLVRRGFNILFPCLPCFSLSRTWCYIKMKFLCLKMKTLVKKWLERNRNTSESFFFFCFPISLLWHSSVSHNMLLQLMFSFCENAFETTSLFFSFFFRMKISCYYDVNQTSSFRLRPRRSEPYADNARGELLIEIRLATGERSSHRPRTR